MATETDLHLQITGMHCASCAARIEKGIGELEGVESCQVNLATNSAVVSYDPKRVDDAGIVRAIDELGYQAVVGAMDLLTAQRKELTEARREFLTALLFALPLMVLAMWPMWRATPLFGYPIDGWLQAVLAAVALFYAGRSILSDAAKQTRRLSANMNSLIAIGTLAAFGWSVWVLVAHGAVHHDQLYFESAGMIVTLILLGRFLEANAKGKAGEAITALMRLRPRTATAIINGVEIEIDAASLKSGMAALVKPGERVPADGVMTEGHATVDESMLTGESLPLEKTVGATVLGGSLNGHSAFTMKVTAIGEASFLSGVIRLVSEAQGRKAPVQKLADRVAAVFVPVVLGLAAVTLLVWYLVAPESPMMVRSVVAVLIIACPCALGLATPTAVLAGTGRAARAGIIVRGGDVLERLATVETVLFDKTGTLTLGKLSVQAVVVTPGVTEADLIGWMAAVEGKSEHPAAKAIAQYASERKLSGQNAEQVTALPGFGVSGELRGRKLLIGNQGLMANRQIDLTALRDTAEAETAQGRTIAYVAADGVALGFVALADQIRPEAPAVITRLRERFGTLVMLSGDNRRTAQEVARAVGLERFEAELLPQDKERVIRSLRQEGHRVAMVGDGINDAPALAAADVGIAVGGGTDIAMETADVILVRHDLRSLADTFTVARAGMATIRQNLFWAFFYNVVAIPVAAGVLYPLFGWTLSPMLAALAMSLSSVFVVSNSLRLSRLRLG
jgi:P-type Cu+ transporter